MSFIGLNKSVKILAYLLKFYNEASLEKWVCQDWQSSRQFWRPRQYKLTCDICYAITLSVPIHIFILHNHIWCPCTELGNLSFLLSPYLLTFPRNCNIGGEKVFMFLHLCVCLLVFLRLYFFPSNQFSIMFCLITNDGKKLGLLIADSVCVFFVLVFSSSCLLWNEK